MPVGRFFSPIAIHKLRFKITAQNPIPNKALGENSSLLPGRRGPALFGGSLFESVCY